MAIEIQPIDRSTAPPPRTAEEPYVGPQPFENRHAAYFFGRNREAEDLVSLVLAHPVVLLYSPSGAGKSSVINAKVVPILLEREHCEVLTTRVTGPFPAEHVQEISNLFVFQALSILAGRDREPQQLVRATFSEFLQQTRPPVDEFESPPTRVLVIDQFEELFTSNPDFWRHRGDFFRQLQDALTAEPNLRVLLAMREEYLANLDPFSSILPGKFKVRFRLDRLRKDAALNAIRKPVEKFNRRFADNVAEELEENLTRVREETPRGPVEVQYEFVEPVQLQVVCQNLWRELRPNESTITMEHLRNHGNVERALQQFYHNTIRQVVAESARSKNPIDEFSLREWFREQLITPSQTRGLVYEESGTVAGMPLSVVQRLEDLHLLKVEVRGKSNWYELTHDRMISPILKDNQEWTATNPWVVFKRFWRWCKSHKQIVGTVALCTPVIVFLVGYSAFVNIKRHAVTKKNQELEVAQGEIQKASDKLQALSRTLSTNRARNALDRPREEIDYPGAVLWLSKARDLDEKALKKSEASSGTENIPVSHTPLRLALAERQLPRLQAIHAAKQLDRSSNQPPVMFSPTGRYLVVRTTNRLCLMDLSLPVQDRDQKAILLKPPQGEVIKQVRFSPEGRFVAGLDGDNFLGIWEFVADSATLVFRSQLASKELGPLEFAEFYVEHNRSQPQTTGRIWLVTSHRSPDVVECDSAIYPNRLAVWDLKNISAPPVLTEEIQRSANDPIALSHDGQYLAAMVRDNSMPAEFNVAPYQMPPSQIAAPRPNPNTRPIPAPRPIAPPAAPRIAPPAAPPIAPRLAAPPAAPTIAGSPAAPIPIAPAVTPGQNLPVLRGGEVERKHFIRIFDLNRLAAAKDNAAAPSGENNDQMISCGEVTFLKFRPWFVWPLLAVEQNQIRLCSQPTAVRVFRGEQQRNDVIDTGSAADFSPDGKRVLIREEGMWRLRNLRWPEDPRERSEQQFTDFSRSSIWEDKSRPVNGYLGNTTIISHGFSPDGRYLAFGTRDRKARVYGTEVGELVYGALEHTSTVGTVAFSSDGRKLLTVESNDQSKEGCARLWEFAQALPEQNYLFGRGISSLWEFVESTAGPVLIETPAASSGRLSKLLHPIDRPRDRIGEFNSDIAYNLFVDPKYRFVLVAHSFEGAPNNLAAPSSENRPRSFLTLHRCVDGKWDAGVSLTLPIQEGTSSPLGRVLFAAFGDEGKWLATVDVDQFGKIGTATVWDLGSAAILKRRQIWRNRRNDAEFTSEGETALLNKQHSEPITSLVISESSLLLATSSEDNTARLWDLKTLDDKGELGAHVANVNQVCFRLQKQGSEVLTVGADGEAILWDAMSNKELRRFDHQAFLNGASFSPDGELLATVGSDSKVRLWHALTGEWISTFHCDYISKAVFLNSERLVGLVKEPGLATQWKQSLVYWDVSENPDIKDSKNRWTLIAARHFLGDPSVDITRLSFAELEQGEKETNLRTSTIEEKDDWHSRQAAAAEYAGNWYAINWHLSMPNLKESFSTDPDLLPARATARFRLGLLKDANQDLEDSVKQIQSANPSGVPTRFTELLLRSEQAQAYAQKFEQLSVSDEKEAIEAADRAIQEYEFVLNSIDNRFALQTIAEFAVNANRENLFDKVLEKVSTLDQVARIAEYCAGIGQYEFALKAYDKFQTQIEVGSAEFDTQCLLKLAMATQRGGSYEAYRDLCQRLIDAAKASDDDALWNDAAWQTVLGHRKDDTNEAWFFADAVDLAERALAKCPKEDLTELHFRSNTLGIAYYRAGNFKKAVEVLADAEKYYSQLNQVNSSSMREVLEAAHCGDLLFLALASRELADDTTLLEGARQIFKGDSQRLWGEFELQYSKFEKRANPYWRLSLEFKIFLRMEAVKKLDVDSSMQMASTGSE